MPIQILDSVVASQIAAGEVVERPASVVKELIENALDAGARRIDVEVRGGGVQELKVQDDGNGIPASDVELAFARHATSKISSADDLWSIQTLGFRGEALPSIASVAQVICRTRTADADLGLELRIAGGEVQARVPLGMPPGTTFVVRNLFYNTPVRRAFLRSDAAESAAVAAVVTQYAVAYPEVRFSLQIDGRAALQTGGGGDLRAALIDLYGLDVARQMLVLGVAFGEGTQAVQVDGLISPPGVTRSSRGGMHLFVNRRAIQSRGQIAAVIEEAYATLLMKGRHPLVVLNLHIHPAAVDVNIHPTKSEVKFRDTPRVMALVGRSIRDTLAQAGVRPWQAEPELGQRRFELQRSVNAPITPDMLADPWGEAADMFVDGIVRSLPGMRVVGQVLRCYVLAESPEGIYLVDQHAAHERIMYEQLQDQRAAAAVERQNLLMPLVVPLAPETAALLLAQAGLLAAYGFEVEDFGAGLRVRALPAGLPEGQAAAALADIAERLQVPGGNADDTVLIALACHAAVRAGQVLAPDEMQALLDQLAHCRAPRTCPHGRPTMILLGTAQIERMFGRTG